VGELSSKVDDKLKDRPYFLCEYAHAMGTGPGNIESYWDVIYAYDNLMGGCIWEMVDHAFEEDGCYTYGGDHDEYMHDGNCFSFANDDNRYCGWEVNYKYED
jgi:beta-galactosidase/beta-glucuronidase